MTGTKDKHAEMGAPKEFIVERVLRTGLVKPVALREAERFMDCVHRLASSLSAWQYALVDSRTAINWSFSDTTKLKGPAGRFQMLCVGHWVLALRLMLHFDRLLARLVNTAWSRGESGAAKDPTERSRQLGRLEGMLAQGLEQWTQCKEYREQTGRFEWRRVVFELYDSAYDLGRQVPSGG